MHEPTPLFVENQKFSTALGADETRNLLCDAPGIAKTLRRFPQEIEKVVQLWDSGFVIVSGTVAIRKSSSVSSSVRKALPKKLRSQFYVCHQPVAVGTFN
jgi:hypothetical protein